MANTFELIASSTVGSGGAASIDFTSIPNTYTDLVLKISGRQGAENAFDITFNGATTSYAVKRLQGDGSSATSNDAAGTTSAIRVIGIASSGSTANTFGNSEIYIPNYAGSTNKSVSIDGVNEDNATAAYMNLAAGIRSNTAAINQITITPRAGNIAQYSTAYLYGVRSS
jgi:hypothetical protein